MKVQSGKHLLHFRQIMAYYATFYHVYNLCTTYHLTSIGDIFPHIYVFLNLGMSKWRKITENESL